jgi:hypothetical protein
MKYWAFTLIAILLTPVLNNGIGFVYGDTSEGDEHYRDKTAGNESSIGQAVPAKWTTRNFSVCISSIAGTKYENLFINGMEEWKEAWPYFSYQLSKGNTCNINVSITKASIELQKAGHAGLTTTRYYENGSIVKADIIIPTQIKGEVMHGFYCCKEVSFEISEKLFYITALHEFGHALNLAHSPEVDEEPVDVMYPSVSEDAQYAISSDAIMTLNKIYGTKGEVKDHEITIKPSVTLEADLNKPVYVFDEKLRLSGKVSKIGGSGTVLLFDPLASLYTFKSFNPNKDGTFSLDIDLYTEDVGIWLLAVQYLGASKFLGFEVKEIPYKIFGQTDKTMYNVGDSVTVSGNVTRPGDKVFLTLINPDGISFASLNSPISSDKTFQAEFPLKKSALTIEGTWTIRITYENASTDVTFNVGKPESSEEIKPEESVLNETKTEEPLMVKIKISAKQVRDLVLLSIRNSEDSNSQVYSFNLSPIDGSIAAQRAPQGWTSERAGMNGVQFTSVDNPLDAGEKIKIRLKVDSQMISFLWSAISDEEETLAEGTVKPILLRGRN